MNFHMTSRAVRVLRVLIMLRAGRLNGAYVMCHAVAGQTKLVNGTEAQQPRISRTVRRVTCRAAFGLERRMLKSEGTLFVRVTLNAGGVCAGSQSRLFKLKATVWVMAITTLHCAFENFVMERHVELGLHLIVATDTQLRVVPSEHRYVWKPRLFGISGRHLVV